MHKELLAAHMPVQGRDALVTVLYEDGRPAEVYVESEHSVRLLGRIVIGKVEAVEKGLAAAFVRISPEQRVYLPLSGKTAARRPGDEFPVQIIQEAQKTKLPKATDIWELSGTFLVFTPGTPRITFSRKLSPEDKAMLRKLAASWGDLPGIMLFRTRAASAEPEELEREYRQLCAQAEDIRRRAATRPSYTILYEPPGLQQRLIARCQPGELQRILTDDAPLAAALQKYSDEAGCSAELYADPQLALYRLRSLTTLLDRLTSRTVPLRSGGTLVIEQTEAFAVIDVNTARYTGKRDMQETVRRINCEAAAEAARQIRLRQLSGTILIDFINSRELREEDELGAILRAGFAADPVSTKLVDFTRLHICEITRRKQQRSLSEQIQALTHNLHM